jgi:hypothetical protein
MQGGKAGEDSHRKFNAGWKTGRPQCSASGVTAMFCKWCEMAGFKHNNRGKPAVWTDGGGPSHSTPTILQLGS